jgi:DoxX-like family
MNILLWILQILGALLYTASGVMKAFMFDKMSVGVPTFGAYPREVWMGLGMLELICVVGLILPGVLHWRPTLTVAAAAILAVESLLFIAAHIKYNETMPLIMSATLGLLMAFVAYGRWALRPL